MYQCKLQIRPLSVLYEVYQFELFQATLDKECLCELGILSYPPRAVMEKRSILAGAVITAAVLCNIVNQGFIGGTTGVLVEYFSRKSDVSESLLGWFGSVATATSLGMGE